MDRGEQKVSVGPPLFIQKPLTQKRVLLLHSHRDFLIPVGFKYSSGIKVML